ncbi:MAG: hypothetical protein M3R34_09245, partial [Acidobacteriota bacterium]|nr:hypothetical protein [Acidobacteriota bacterium]
MPGFASCLFERGGRRGGADGASIFVFRPSAPPLRVEKVDVKTGRRTLWKEIRPPDPSGVEQVGP